MEWKTIKPMKAGMVVCLILFAFKVHPTHKLIVAANRDESYSRPTAAAEFWKDAPNTLAGRDLEKMGTWMGITTSGRFAALTNYRDPMESTKGKRSRGNLVADFLNGDEPPEEFMKRVADDGNLYPGYNLLTGTSNELYYYSNIGKEVQMLQPGIYGLSNHLLNTDWPKVKVGKTGLERIVRKDTQANDGKEKIVKQLFDLLQTSDPAPDEQLPNTGVGLDLERMLSPMFIKSDGYGTRCSTVCLAGSNELYYAERTYFDSGISDRNYTIKL